MTIFSCFDFILTVLISYWREQSLIVFGKLSWCHWINVSNGWYALVYSRVLKMTCSYFRRSIEIFINY